MINEKDMMHGQDYDGQDVSGWLMSEKLNGCRAYWDGQSMWTRGGKEIRIPDAMRAALPDVHLDGEMFAGRDSFEVARLAVQYGKFTDAVQFVAFDLPGMGSCPFEYRYIELTRMLPLVGLVRYSKHIDCQNIEHTTACMNRVQSLGGEGLVLRDPAEVYRPGYPSRTQGVLKLKELPGGNP